MAIKEFRLPDPGEGLVEADIVTWRVAVGDQVKVNDIVVEVETSKSLVELPSPFAGHGAGAAGHRGRHGRRRRADHRDRRRLRSPREPRTPGRSGPGPAGGRGRRRRRRRVAEEDAPGGRVADLVGYGPKTDRGEAPAAQDAPTATAAPVRPTSRRASTFATDAAGVAARRPARAAAAGTRPKPSVRRCPDPGRGAEPAAAGRRRVLAKPPVRKLAKDLGVDLARR